MNIVNAIERAARCRTEEVAVRHGEATQTYGDLLDSAARFAGFLQRQGLNPGDRVGIYLHNEAEWLPALLGIWKAGGVAVPFNYLVAPAALRHAAVDSGARWLLALGSDLGRLREVLADLPLASKVITTSPSEGAMCSLGEALAGDVIAGTEPRLDGDDAILMYTSGSTGTPKGVRQTHRNIAAVCEAAIDAWGIGPGDHALVCTPLFHVGGLQLISLPLLFVGGMVTLRRWNTAEWLDAALASRPTLVALVPAMMIDIVNFLGDRSQDLSSIRVCMIGGSALPEARLKAFTAATGIVPINIYGQTEQNGVSITEPLSEERRFGSLGKPLKQIVQWQIVATDSHEPLPFGANEVGELWVRGDAVTPGYWQLPDVNLVKFKPGNWFRTTDLVREQPDGYLYYVERGDDMIISGGENIYPQAIEGHLLACPLIAEVTVIGTPHERLSEQVTAIVVPSQPTVTTDEIAAFCASQPDLRGLNRPRRIEIVDAIPRTATNKIDKPALRAKFVQ